MKLSNLSGGLYRLGFVIVLAAFWVGGCQSADKGAKTNKEPEKRKEYAIAIHGGAGVISKDIDEKTKQEYLDALDEALTIGENELKNGGKALDAVEKVINYLEDNPHFNAGKGAVYTATGEHELDAAIMDGSTMEAGAVTGVRTVKNPISLARLVMKNSRHILFSVNGAEAFADKMGVERVKNSYFDTEHRYKQWKAAQKESGHRIKVQPDNTDPDMWDANKYGTVGCVALDKDGHLAAGTSTGGLTNKEYGRVGDVPIIGDGTYANGTVAVSATGIGEEIMRYNAGFRVAAYMRYKNASLDEATSHVINDVLKPGDAGIITVDQYGNISTPFNTLGMFRGKADSEGLHEVKIWE